MLFNLLYFFVVQCFKTCLLRQVYSQEYQVRFTQSNRSLPVNAIRDIWISRAGAGEQGEEHGEEELQDVSMDADVEDDGASGRRNGSDKGLLGQEAEEEAALEALLVEPLRALSKVAHHYCDVLHHSAGSTRRTRRNHGVSPPSEASEEAVLRKDLLQLVVRRIGEVKAEIRYLHRQRQELNTTYSNTVLKRAAAGAGTGTGTGNVAAAAQREEHAEGSELMVFRREASELHRRTRMLNGVLVQLLQRAAEAGNDLFGALPADEEHLSDRLEAAQHVLHILQVRKGVLCLRCMLNVRNVYAVAPFKYLNNTADVCAIFISSLSVLFGV
jgi:hypothetical protein